MSIEETGTGRGIRIYHEGSGKITELFAGYDEAGGRRLDLKIGRETIYLTAEETAFFLAWMVAWHAQGRQS